VRTAIYLCDVGWRLERKDADDLLKPADLDEHEGVAESAGGRRQTAEQQVPVTVVTKVRKARLVSRRRLGHYHDTRRVRTSAAARPSTTAATTAGGTERPRLGSSGGATAACWVYVATCNMRAPRPAAARFGVVINGIAHANTANQANSAFHPPGVDK